MEQIRKAIKLVSPVTGATIWAAVQSIAKEYGEFLPVKRPAILEDDGHGFAQGFVLGFESMPTDPILWLVIGHGPAADPNLAMEKSFPTLFLRTSRNLEYKPSEETFEQRLVARQEAISGYLSILAEQLEKQFLPAS